MSDKSKITSIKNSLESTSIADNSATALLIVDQNKNKLDLIESVNFSSASSDNLIADHSVANATTSNVNPSTSTSTSSNVNHSRAKHFKSSISNESSNNELINNNDSSILALNSIETKLSRNNSLTFSAKSHNTKHDKKSIASSNIILLQKMNQNSGNEPTGSLIATKNASIADSYTVASINNQATSISHHNPSLNNSSGNTKTRRHFKAHNQNSNLFDTTSLDSNSSMGSIYSISNNHQQNLNLSQANQNMNSNVVTNNESSIFYSNSNIHNLTQQQPTNVLVKDPIVIRGAGNITIFGISNKFNEQFPSQLNAKLAPEEFRDTIKQINQILTKELSNSFKWLVFGSIFCCCTLGCSLLPVIFMNKKAKLSVNKLLEMENQRLYLKLGLKWRLTKIKYNSNSLLEYVLLVEFLPTILLYQPD